MSAEERSETAPGIFLVRAEVRDDLRDAFDQWYEAEHLPQATEVLGADSSRRAWSTREAGVHCAIYEFDDVKRLEAQVPSPGLQILLDAFDQAWPEGVTRTREILAVSQFLPSP